VSDNTMLFFLQKTMGKDATVHGFRSTFRTWADDHLIPAGVDDDAIEMCLAHRSGSGGKRASKVKRAYRRGTLLAARVPIMLQWAALCQPAADNVVALPRKAVA
jgi:integrase